MTVNHRSRRRRQVARPSPERERRLQRTLSKVTDVWLPPLLAWVALSACYLAAVSAISNGNTPLSIYTLYDFDTVRPWLVFRDMFMDGGFDVSGWNLGNNRNLVDYLVAFPVYAFFLALDMPTSKAVYVGQLFVPLGFMALQAGGWTLFAREALGRRAPTHASVVLVAALPPLVVGLGLGNWFAPTYRLVYHYGSWVMVPWMAWATLRCLRPSKQPWRAALALLVLSSLGATNSNLTVPWFFGPAIAAIILAMLPPTRLRWQLAIWPLGAVALGWGSERAVAWLLPFGTTDRADFGFGNPFEHLDPWLKYWWVIGSENPLLSMVLIAFLVMCVIRSTVTILGAGRVKTREGNFGVLMRPGTRARAVVATHFVTVCTLGMLLLSLLARHFATFDNLFEDHLSSTIRSYIPAFSLPLFFGWLLVPWAKPAFMRLRHSSAAVALSMCSLSLLLVAVKGLPLSNVNPFATDFKTCLRKLAVDNEWTGIVGSSRFLTMAADPASPITRFLPVGLQRKMADTGKSVFYLDFLTFNKNMFKGEFDAIVTTYYDGYVYWSPPAPPYTDRCHKDDWSVCFPPNYAGYHFNAADVRAGFGEPQAAYVCDGLVVMHYDPPLTFDFTGERGRLGVMVNEPFYSI